MTRSSRGAPGIAVAACAFVFVWGLTTHGKYSASGDEPHYLIVARSLFADRDLDVANNYAANDGRLIGHDQLEAGPHVRAARGGRVLSVHDAGLPVLLAPVYGVAAAIAARVPEPLLTRFRMTQGLFTYSLISLAILAVVMAGVALLVTGLTYIVDRLVAAAAGAVVALTPPVVSHSFLVFPEAIAFVVACGVVWWILNPSPSRAATWALIAALGLLPWCHRKYSIFVIACAVALIIIHSDVWRRWSSRELFAACCLFLIPHALLYAWTIGAWGNIGGPQLVEDGAFTLTGAVGGLAGFWLDRQYGLLAYSPIYFFLPACWAVVPRRHRWAILPVVCFVLPMAAFAGWWGGFSPAARYLVPMMPFCAIAIAYGLRYRFLARLAAILLLPQIVIVGYAWQHPRTLWPIGQENPLLERLGTIGRAYEHALPSLRYGEVDRALVAGILLIAANVAIAALVRRRYAGVRDQHEASTLETI